MLFTTNSFCKILLSPRMFVYLQSCESNCWQFPASLNISRMIKVVRLKYMIKRTRFFLIFASFEVIFACARARIISDIDNFVIVSCRSNRQIATNWWEQIGGRRWTRFGNRDYTAEGIGSVVKLSKFARFAPAFYSVLSDLTLPPKKETTLLTAKLRAKPHIVPVRVFVDEIRNSIASLYNVHFHMWCAYSYIYIY